MRRDEGSIVDIVVAAKDAIGFSAGMTRAGFAADRRTRMVVQHAIAIVGEATRRLSEAFRQTHAQVPWGEMAGMRDRLVHAYDAVDLDVVRDTVTRDLPRIVALLEPLTP